MADRQQEARRELARRELARRKAASQQQAQPNTAQAPQPEQAHMGHKIGAFFDGAAQGLTMGFSDEIAAGLNSGFGLIGSYDDDLAAIRERMAENQRLAFGYKAAGEIPGMVATAVGTGGAGLAAKGALKTGAIAAGEGAAFGGLYGAGTAEDDKLGGAVQGAVTGAIAGPLGAGAGKLVSSGASKLAGALGKKPATLSASQLGDAATAAYQKADDAGIILKPGVSQGMLKNVQDDLAGMAYHPAMQPKIKPVLKELKRAGKGNATLKGVDTIRKMAGNAFDPMNKTSSAMGGKISERIDEALDGLSPSQVLSGKADEGVGALKEARELYQRSRKLEKVDELIERAGLNAGSTGSGGNIENATRQQLKRMLTDKKLSRGLSKDEKAALKKAVLGSTANNAARLAGKLSPQGNGLMMTMGLGGAALAPQFAIPAMAIGAGAKMASEKVTAKNVKLVRDMIARGGKALPKNKAQKRLEAPEIQRLIAKSILGSSLAQTP